MTIRLTLVWPSRTTPCRESDIVIDASPETPMATLAARLRDAAGVRDEAVLYTTSGPLRLAGTLADSALRNGALLGVGEPPPGAHRGVIGPALAVLAGPDAGAFAPLTPRLLVGRDPNCDLTLTDVEASRRHALLTHDASGPWLADAGSTNGTWLRGTAITGTPVRLPRETPVRCGNNLLAVIEPEASPLAATTSAPGFVDARRPPRLSCRPLEETIRYPTEPMAAAPSTSPWLPVGFSAACSLLLGFLWWGLTGGSAGGAGMLGIMAMSPVLLLVHVAVERLSRRREVRAARAEHQAATDAADRRVELATEAEAQRRRSAHPDPVRLAAIAAGPTGRLWERRPSDDDWLELRVGLATLPARFTVSRPGRADAPEANEHPGVPFVPATVRLGVVGVLGITGVGRHPLARWLVAQLAVLHSPRDLRLAFLAGRSSETWRSARWFPHRQGPGITTSNDAVVVVIDDVDQLAADPVVVETLRSGRGGSAFAICLAKEPHLLPESCKATVEATATASATLRVGGEAPLTGITADFVTAGWLENVGRALAPLRECRPTTADPSSPPQPVGLDSLLGLPPPSAGTNPATVWAERIAERWQVASRDMTVPLGVNETGPVLVDLVADGPHALVAGTTGAGKSELLRSWLAGLAVANRPEELSLLLIDYKGGAAFAECAKLPHTAGLVTDLDTALTTRMLRSLAAELRRRERIFAAADVSGLSEYQVLRDQRRGVSVPRLLVVVDEFAALTEEFPDLIGGLVDLARRGRSLGMHLVLATQRPAGVISSQLRANTALRVCLRVTDPDDSVDVLGSGVAAEIVAGAPGRGYLRLQGRLVSVQVAHVRDLCPEPATTSPRVVPVPWHGEPEPEVVAPQAREGHGTMLSVLVRAVRGAADTMATTPVAPPWLPPLPSQLPLTRLLGGVFQCPSGIPGADIERHPVDQNTHGAPLGLRDLPDEQTQSVYRLDLAEPVRLAFVGGPGSGKSNALRTLAASVASTYSPQEVRIFVFDGDGELSDLARLPHCDAVVTRGDVGHAQRVWQRLRLESQRRAGRTPTDGTPPPWLLVLLDSWDALDAESSAGRDLMATAGEILQAGTRYGIRAAVAGGRMFLTSRFFDLFTHKLVLRLPRRDDYSLLEIPDREVPREPPAGRALIVGSSVTQLQLATIAEDPSKWRDSFKELAAHLRVRWPDSSTHAIPVRALPALATTAQLTYGDEPWSFPVGIGGDSGKTVSLRLAEDRIALVAGPPGSGKTTALLALALAGVRHGHRVVLLTGRGDVSCPALRGVIRARTPDELRRAIAEAATALVLVDDFDPIPDAAVDEVLFELMAQPRYRIMLAGNVDNLSTAYRGCVVRAQRSRTGVLLGPQPGDGELLGVHRTGVWGGEPSRPGRGILIQHGVPTHVQIALPTVDSQPTAET